MRILKLILFTITLALACSISYGQAPTKVAFGGTRPIDTAWAGRHLRIDSTVRFLKYSTSDATKYLRINASGFLELGTPAGGGGNADSATFFTNYRADTMRSNIYTQLGLKGTVTNVSTGFGMLGGPITTTGTVRVDSNAVMTLARGYKVSDSVALLDSTRLADTSLNLRAVFAADLSDSMTVARDSVVKRVPYRYANDSVLLGEYPIRAGQFRFDLTPTMPTVVGGMYWDTGNVTVSVPLNADVTLQVGQETFVRARNNTGATITNGSAVYISGAQGNNPTISLANADSANTSYVVGVATEDIGINATGFVTVTGVVNGVNTSSWAAGDRLYLSTTNGQITNTPPSEPHMLVGLGVALNSTNNGRIFVRPSAPIATDTNLVNGTTVAPTQYAVRKYIQSQGYGIGTIKALTGDVTASGTGTVTATLATVNASPATYTNATVTVDSKGRVTSASSGTAPVTSVSGTSGRISSTGGTTPVLDLVTVNATPATYGGASAIPVVTVDAYGRATTVSTVTPTYTTITQGTGVTVTGTAPTYTISGTGGTVTSVGVVAGTGVSIGGTSPITTSGTYTITNTAPDQTVSLTGAGTVSVTGTYPTFTVTGTGGSGGVTSITSTGSTMQVTGTTTVNVEVDTTHNFTFTGTNTFTRDITIDSATFGTGNGLSTNIKIGRTALSAPTTATGIVAIGENAGRLVTTGQNDIYIGRNAAGNSGTGVSGHVGIGTGNLNYSTGDNNTAIGFNVMARAVAWNGIANVGVGINAGNVMTTATANTFLGSGTAAALTSGSSNTFLGVSSGSAMTTGGSNVILGGYTGNAGGLDIRTSSNRMVLSDGAGNIRAYHNATNWLFGTVTDGSTGLVQINGNLGLNTAGNKLNIATGANASIGTGTLSGGTVTINTTAVTASSIIQVQLTSCSSCGALYIGTVTAGTSFVVNSTNILDASTFNYWIIN